MYNALMNYVNDVTQKATWAANDYSHGTREDVRNVVREMLEVVRRGEIVEVKLAKNKPNGDPEYRDYIVWDCSATHIYVCHVDGYVAWCKGELGTVTINGKVFKEVPWHIGMPRRDVRRKDNE